MNTTDAGDYTALIWVTLNSQIECVNVLVEEGDDVNRSDATGTLVSALLVAATNGRVDILNVSIRAGADLNANDIENDTPLKRATLYNRVDCARALIYSGADFASTLIWAKNTSYKKAYKVLKESGLDVNKTAKHGATPLISASVNGNRDLVEALIEF